MLCEHNEEIVIRSQAIRYRGLINPNSLAVVLPRDSHLMRTTISFVMKSTAERGAQVCARRGVGIGSAQPCRAAGMAPASLLVLSAVTTVWPASPPVPLTTTTAPGPARLPAEPGHKLVPVAPVPRLRPLHGLAGYVVGVPGQQQQGQASVDLEQLSVMRVGQHRLDRFLGLGQLDAVYRAQRLVQRPVPLQLLAEAGEAPGGQVRGVDRHRLAVGEP